MATYPRGAAPTRPFPYYNEVMTGFEYTAAVGMLYEGMDGGRACKCIQAIRDRYDGARRSPFDEAECGHHYARAMAELGGRPGADRLPLFGGHGHAPARVSTRAPFLVERVRVGHVCPREGRRAGLPPSPVGDRGAAARARRGPPRRLRIAPAAPAPGAHGRRDPGRADTPVCHSEELSPAPRRGIHRCPSEVNHALPPPLRLRRERRRAPRALPGGAPAPRPGSTRAGRDAHGRGVCRPRRRRGSPLPGRPGRWSRPSSAATPTWRTGWSPAGASGPGRW